MTNLDIVLILTTLGIIGIGLGISLTIWFIHKKTLAEFDKKFLPTVTLIPATYWDQSDTPEIGTKVSLALNLAHQSLKILYPGDQVAKTLANIRIQIMPTDVFESYQRKVAGVAYSDLNIVLVGPKLEALCHELIHVMEDRVEGAIDYDHKGWNYMKFKACNQYLTALRETFVR